MDELKDSLVRELKFVELILDSWNLYIIVPCASILCLLLTWNVCLLIEKQMNHADAERRMQKKRHQRDVMVHDCLSLEVPKIAPIADALQLANDLRNGKQKCSAVMLNCINRSHRIGNKVLSSVTDEMYDEAYSRAQELDKLTKSAKSKLGLFGIPISIKDNIHVKGTDSTLGAAVRCLHPLESDALLVQAIRNAGGVPFVKSNIPQLLLMPESENRIFGVARNPWSLDRTPGGSSGGEAALIAAGCSILGVGGDIGGSIRIPACYCGIFGFKPSNICL